MAEKTRAVTQSAVELVVGLLRLGAELTPVILCLVALRVAASRPSARSMELPPRTHPTDQYGDDLLATLGGSDDRARCGVHLAASGRSSWSAASTASVTSCSLGSFQPHIPGLTRQCTTPGR